jgi:hypothetical protein
MAVYLHLSPVITHVMELWHRNFSFVALAHFLHVFSVASRLLSLLLQRQAIQDEIQRRQEAMKEEERQWRGQCRNVEGGKVDSDRPGHIERSRSCSFVRVSSNSRKR